MATKGITIDRGLTIEEETDLAAQEILEVTDEDVSDEVFNSVNQYFADQSEDKEQAKEDAKQRIVQVTHTRPRMIMLHYPNGDGALVPRTNVRALRALGLTLTCVLCEKVHKDTTPNACTGREVRKFVICQFCRNFSGKEKKIYDDLIGGTAHALLPGEIQLPGTAYSTPEQRIFKNWLNHCKAYHGNEYQSFTVNMNQAAFVPRAD